MLLDAKREKTASEILRTVQASLNAQLPETSSQEAMLGFIQEALEVSWTSFGMVSYHGLHEMDARDFEQHVRKARARPELRWKSQKLPTMVRVSGSMVSYKYGHVATWDVRDVIDMDEAFSNCEFAEPLDLRFWDTRNVRSMNKTFSGFQGLVDVGTWDTRRVLSMSGMFSGASKFNCDIGKWDTSKVKDMTCMFARADKFDQDIGGWNTSSVTDMSHMFHGASTFNRKLKWDTRSVKRHAEMFSEASSMHDDNEPAFSQASGFGREARQGSRAYL